MRDRSYTADIHDESCTRAFFERKRATERTDSHITSICTTTTTKQTNTTTNSYTSQRSLHLAADRYYGSVTGGLFNLPPQCDDEAEAALHSTLRADGKHLPASQAARLSSFEQIVSRTTVKAAISGMARGSTPGLDGFPIEFFALFVLPPKPGSTGEPVRPSDQSSNESEEEIEALRVIDLLVNFYCACEVDGTLPAELNTSVTTLIHKKGARNDLSNYRPISVCTVIYKILARCLADALQTALPWIIDHAQVACQEGKSCFSNTRYIQDLIHYCDTEQLPGLFVLCDATKAFDRVQHGYLLRTMAAMDIPPAFCRLYSVLLCNATTHIKVNDYLRGKISLRNGVRQGDPVAALARGGNGDFRTVSTRQAADTT